MAFFPGLSVEVDDPAQAFFLSEEVLFAQTLKLCGFLPVFLTVNVTFTAVLVARPANWDESEIVLSLSVTLMADLPGGAAKAGSRAKTSAVKPREQATASST